MLNEIEMWLRGERGDVCQRIAEALLRPDAAPAAPPADGGTDEMRERFPYQPTFDAIAAATRIEASGIAISVDKLWHHFAAISSRTPAGATGDPVGENEAAFLRKVASLNVNVWTRDEIIDLHKKALATRPASPAPAASAGGADHEFKSDPSVFWPAARGTKTFEFRKDDRGGYRVGQTVRLRCYVDGAYTDDAPLDRRITNILYPGQFGLQDGYCILSLAALAPAAFAKRDGAIDWPAVMRDRADWAATGKHDTGGTIKLLREVADVLDAALAPAAQVNPGREEIARIVFSYWVSSTHAAGIEAAEADWDAGFFPSDRSTAYAVADAILAARPVAEGDAESLTLTALHQANIVRQAEWCAGGDPEPDLAFRGVELAGETGEALNVIKKLERERRGWRGSRAVMNDLAEELADVVICADLCAVSAGIDLGAAVVAKFNATSAKVGLTTMLPAALAASPAPRAPAAVPEELRQARAVIAEALGLFASAIKSGEAWSPTCEIVKIAAYSALDTLDAAPAAPPADGGTEGLREALNSIEAKCELARSIYVTEEMATPNRVADAFVLVRDVARKALSSRTPAGAAGDPVGNDAYRLEAALAEAAARTAEVRQLRTNLSNTQAAYEDAIATVHELATRPASPAPAASAGGKGPTPDTLADSLGARVWRLQRYAAGLNVTIARLRMELHAALAPAAQVNPGREEIAEALAPFALLCGSGNLLDPDDDHQDPPCQDQDEWFRHDGFALRVGDFRRAKRVRDAILSARPVAEGDANR